MNSLRVFLIDFENVSDNGMEGFSSLSEQDQVYIFYTQNSAKISIEFMRSFVEQKQKADTRFIKVTAGKQALDLQLSSFLGFLVSNGTTDKEYFIISKDKGFLCLQNFWKTSDSVSAALFQADSIRRALQLDEEQHRQTAEPAEPRPTAVKPAETKPAEPKPTAVKPAETKPAEAENLPQDAAAQKEAGQEATAQTASAKEEAKKKAIPSPSKKSQLNANVQKALSKAKFENAMINSTASIVCEAFGKENYKQLVYRQLLKLHGQKRGLEVYNQIKSLL